MVKHFENNDDLMMFSVQSSDSVYVVFDDSCPEQSLSLALSSSAIGWSAGNAGKTFLTGRHLLKNWVKPGKAGVKITKSVWVVPIFCPKNTYPLGITAFAILGGGPKANKRHFAGTQHGVLHLSPTLV